MQITHCIVLRLLSSQILNYPKLSQQTYSSTILTIPKNELFQDIASNFPKITPRHRHITERNVIVPRFVKLSQNDRRENNSQDQDYTDHASRMIDAEKESVETR